MLLVYAGVIKVMVFPGRRNIYRVHHLLKKCQVSDCPHTASVLILHLGDFVLEVRDQAPLGFFYF